MTHVGRRGVDRDGVARVFREEYGRAVAVLVRLLGDIDLAEEAVQDAWAVALERWPRDGLPDNPGAWIVRTARNGAIDRLRRDADRLEFLEARHLARHRAAAGRAGDDLLAELLLDLLEAALHLLQHA